MSTSWWVIANPYSGRRGEVVTRARAALEAHAVEFELRESHNATHVADLVRQRAVAVEKDRRPLGPGHDAISSRASAATRSVPTRVMQW